MMKTENIGIIRTEEYGASLRENLDFLFTYQEYPELSNTTNSLDGSFGHKNSFEKSRCLGLRDSRNTGKVKISLQNFICTKKYLLERSNE